MSSQTRSPHQILDSYLFTSPTNVFASDNFRASASINPLKTAELAVKDFRFNIPAGATINGVVVSVEGRSNPVYGYISQAAIQVYGTYYRKNTTVELPANDAIKTFGSAVDKWGAVLTSDNINYSTFAVLVLLDVQNNSIIEIDHIQCTVYYTEGLTNVDEIVSFAMGASVLHSEPPELGGTAFLQIVNFSMGAGAGTAYTTGVQETVDFALGAGLHGGHDKEKIAAKIITATGTVYAVKQFDALQIVETTNKPNVVQRYQDNSCRIYFKGTEQKTWMMKLKPNDTTLALVRTLRSVETDLTLYPDYHRDQSKVYRVRVDNRAPLKFAAGMLAADETLKLFFTQVA